MMSEVLEKPIVLSLCSGSGSWEKPYVDSGKYNVIPVTFPEYDVRLFPSKPSENPRETYEWTYIEKYQGKVLGILAAPDCTYFSNAGTAHRRTDQNIIDGIGVVDACFRIAYALKPKFFALENPVGKLKNFLGEPVFKFHPYEFGDMYSKKTYLWGWFNTPKKIPYASRAVRTLLKEQGFNKEINNEEDINMFEGSPALDNKELSEAMSGLYYKNKIESGEFTAPSDVDLNRKYYRSITSQGFANAFFKANQ